LNSFVSADAMPATLSITNIAIVSPTALDTLMMASYRVYAWPDGWLEPWIFAWQFVQARPKTFLSDLAYGSATAIPSRNSYRPTALPLRFQACNVIATLLRQKFTGLAA
jgi:hypothetical protein